MAKLFHWTPRHNEAPHWVVASRSHKAFAAIISFREKNKALFLGDRHRSGHTDAPHRSVVFYFL